MSFLVTEVDAQIGVARHELAGTRYLRYLRTLMEDVSRERVLTHEYLLPGSQLSANPLSIRAKIDQDFADLAVVDQELGDVLQTAAPLADLQRSWDTIKAAAGPLPDNPNDDPYLKLMLELRNFIAEVGNNSSLVLDPQLNSYWTMNVAVVRLPVIQDLLTSLVIHGEDMTRREGLRRRPGAS